MSKLEVKYRELKLWWKKTTDSVKTGSGLKGKIDEAWYVHLNSVMKESQFDEVVISSIDTSYIAEDVEPSETTN